MWRLELSIWPRLSSPEVFPWTHTLFLGLRDVHCGGSDWYLYVLLLLGYFGKINVLSYVRIPISSLLLRSCCFTCLLPEGNVCGLVFWLPQILGQTQACQCTTLAIYTAPASLVALAALTELNPLCVRFQPDNFEARSSRLRTCSNTTTCDASTSTRRSYTCSKSTSTCFSTSISSSQHLDLRRKHFHVKILRMKKKASSLDEECNEHAAVQGNLP